MHFHPKNNVIRTILAESERYFIHYVPHKHIFQALSTSSSGRYHLGLRQTWAPSQTVDASDATDAY